MIFLSIELIQDLKILEKKLPGGRVVSAADWQSWGPGFDSSQSQNFFSEELKVLNALLVVFLFNFNVN